MTPNLVAIDGPLKGTVLPLSEPRVAIGRDEANQLVLDDLAVSRYHCILERDRDCHKLTDLESRNGTFVNGVPVHERRLALGDEIRIGLSVFLFLLSAPFPPEPNDEPDTAAPAHTRSIAELRREDSVYLRADESIRASGRAARDLHALLRISSEIHQLHSASQVYDLVLKCVLEFLSVDRAAVFRREGEAQGCDFAAGLDSAGSATKPFQVDRTLARKVLTGNVAVLADSPPPGELSVIAAPIVCLDHMDGILYIESRRPARFDSPDLEFATALASLAGLALGNLSRMDQLTTENRRLKDEIQLQHEMVGESPAMHKVYDAIAKIARSDSTVLICGENGTGKELAARAIFQNSARSLKPFLTINCAALTETLLESELFGHERGAFTGAVALKRGKFEVADGGTVFLDEVGELAASIQAKLLRVLQQHEFDRVGGTKPIRVDVRVIAATNRDLRAAVAAGTFRPDLFFRLNVVSVAMPPLRTRREDVGLLANYFVAKVTSRANRRISGISDNARAWLLRYDWPGNVRELENAIERAVVMGSSDLIMPEDLPESILEFEPLQAPPLDRFHEAVNQAKRDVVRRVLEQTHGVQTEAAKVLGIHPVHLNRLIRKLGLS